MLENSTGTLEARTNAVFVEENLIVAGRVDYLNSERGIRLVRSIGILISDKREGNIEVVKRSGVDSNILI